MSDSTNTNLLERAAEMVDYWGDTTAGKVIEADLERNDLDALNKHVCEAEAIASQQEFETGDIM